MLYVIKFLIINLSYEPQIKFTTVFTTTPWLLMVDHVQKDAARATSILPNLITDKEHVIFHTKTQYDLCEWNVSIN